MSSKTNKIVESVYSEGFRVFENFIDEQAIDTLLKIFSSKQSLLKESGIGNGDFNHQKNIRNDKIAWIEKNQGGDMDRVFLIGMDKLMKALNQRCFLGLNNFESHFAKYEPGAFYKRHKDSFSNDDARKISVILYLNKNWKEGDGGELNMYNEITLCVQPMAGTLVVFESHIEHEVLLSNQNRISITGWMRNDPKVF